jgi:CheY-like chemotaxis protein
VEAGKTDVRPVKFSVADLFGGLRGALRPLRVSDSVELVFDEPVGIPEVYADEAKIAQILRNFVSNALKFTEVGEVRVSAVVADPARLIFKVKDTGVGIAPEHHLTVFQEFSQVDNALQGKVKGTGLGLPLSKKLAELMGGEVYLESEPGKGSAFFLNLPIVEIESETPVIPERLAAAKRVLVIDDDATFRYVIRQTLSDTGYQIHEAVDGIEGLERARSLRPDIIFLDLYMPRLDGYSVLLDLARTFDRYRPIVIIVTSTVLGPVERARLTPADAVISKENLSRNTVLKLIAQD